MKIGFVGVGVMGNGMVNRLLAAGYDVKIHTRTKTKANPLLEAGAKWADSLNQLTDDRDAVITIVGYPDDVEEVYFGDTGLLTSVKPGTYLIDMTTSTPTLAKRIADAGSEKGAFVLDAPVSGGDIGAREGKLSIMVGGDKDKFDAVKPIIEAMGTNLVYQGESGAGQHTKMCNQIAIASNMLGVAEAIAYAEHAGLSPERVLESITTGAAGSWSLSQLAPRIIKGDFEPGFYIKHFVKDLKIAIEEAERMGLELPGLKLSKGIYSQLIDLGYGDKGTQAVQMHYR
ncbi:NAD(P)-dependent oxidoreductase [Thalassobacillus pellis]|uniref:NAD(P)-dependent oxidoreductase n=1 Tax=Thalassobacillus pellis TaxID=748008 RepID=UPI0019604CD3|nr:NAD(P)-dependent oxidoreductase [Thalassobacillus pellis]MBM7552970.1 3-hydroxyisobutyrate dehydrogenase [Thalassobacillus pellis]